MPETWVVGTHHDTTKMPYGLEIIDAKSGFDTLQMVAEQTAFKGLERPSRIWSQNV